MLCVEENAAEEKKFFKLTLVLRTVLAYWHDFQLKLTTWQYNHNFILPLGIENILCGKIAMWHALCQKY